MPPEIATPTADNLNSTTIPALVNESIIRRHYIPICKRTFSRWISSGRFPRAEIIDGAKLRLWRRETVESWVASTVTRGGFQ